MPNLGIDLARQGELVPAELRQTPAIVVGAGTTGSWCAHSLLRMGWTQVTLIDSDTVESHNTPAQFHLAGGMGQGMPKVDAFAEAMVSIGLPVPHRMECGTFPEVGEIPKGANVFSCVDTVEARRHIAKAAQAVGARRLVDFRMGPENGSVLYVGDEGPIRWDAYFKTLDRVFAPVPACGKRAMLTTGLAVVSFGLGHWIAGERRNDLAERLDIDLLTARMEAVAA